MVVFLTTGWHVDLLRLWVLIYAAALWTFCMAVLIQLYVIEKKNNIPHFYFYWKCWPFYTHYLSTVGGYWRPHRGGILTFTVIVVYKVHETWLAVWKDSENHAGETNNIWTNGKLHPLLHFTNLYHLIFLNFQEGRRMSEENGGIATTEKTRRTKRGDGRGRERGRETQVNVKTLTTGTKRSTGIAEAMTQTHSHLKTASYSSALDKV